MEKQLVLFELGSENFGVDIYSVHGISGLQDIEKIPGSPSFVEGMTNLRGQILPVVDLHNRFGITSQECNDEKRIMITDIGDVKIGLIVSAVSDVITIDDDLIESSNLLDCKNTYSNYVIGEIKKDEHQLFLVDVAVIFSIIERSMLKYLGLGVCAS
ncbi:MAG: chemotaxis protein CheW [Anaerolinea sp.]|nr:chemotaxis protein CheW [Anaerolinea sp.]